MDLAWLSWMTSQQWLYTGILLILVFPLALILLGELIQRLPASQKGWIAILRNIKQQILPQLVFLLILTTVLDLDRSHIAVKVVETFLWIFVIHTTLAIVNELLFFTTATDSDWRTKIPKLVLDFTRAFLVLIGASLVLAYVWDLPLGKLLTALGVGSIVLGLALQDTLSSLFSGFALLSSRQFRIGDWLSLPDNRIGKVISMNWRTVTLLTRDEDILIVPNADLAKSTYTNFSHPYPRHMERLPFDFSFDDSPHKVKDALIEAALATPGILHDPAPAVALQSYDEFSVRHEVRYFIAHYDDQPRIRDDFMSRIWYVAKRHGITFPTRAHEVVVMPSLNTTQADDNSATLDLLRHFSFLRNCGKELENIAASANVLEFGRGEVVIAQGSISTALYLIVSGKAEEIHQDSAGQEHVIDDIGYGDFFGLGSLIRQEGSDITVRAVSDMQVIAIPEATTHQLMDRFPDLANEMEHIIERRMRMVKRMDSMAQKKEAGRHQDTTGKVVRMKNIMNN